MPEPKPLTLEAFAAVLAANGYAPDDDKLRALYAALPTVQAMQARVRSATAEMALEPAHVFQELVGHAAGDRP